MTTEIYKETPRYKATLEHLEGEVFLHLEVYEWTPSVFKELRKEFSILLDKTAESGHELLFTYYKTGEGEDGMTAKMMAMIHPLYDLRPTSNQSLDETVWVGAWDTGLET